MRKIKVGIFTDSFRPYTSGVVHSIETLTRELAAREHEFYIFAPSYPNYNKKESRVFRFVSVPAPTNPSYSLALPFSIRLKPTMQRLQLNIVHVHSPFLLGRLGAKYARKLGVPLVFTFHTLYDHYIHYVPFKEEITKSLTQKFCAHFSNGCDLVISPTAVIAKHLRNIGVTAPIEVIPTGIQLEDYTGEGKGWLQERYGISPEELVLLCVGRLGKEKNIEFILRSFRHLASRREGIRLVLVGGGPEENALKELAQNLGIRDRVIFTGSLSREDVIKCYESSHLFVFSSLTETQGLVIAEAKAAGLPVVAVDAFGVSEMVVDGEDGFLCPPEEEVFASRVEMLLENRSLYAEMGVNARRNARKLSAQNCAAKMIECYQKLIYDNKKLSFI